MQDLIIRKVAPADAARLTEIAHASKRYWNYPEEWIDQWSTVLTITSDYVLEHTVVVAELDGQIVGFYAISQGKEALDLDHFWIHPDWIGQGLGRTLFRHVVSNLESIGPRSTLEIESDPHAEAFYLRMGAFRIESTTTSWNGLVRTLPKLRYSK